MSVVTNRLFTLTIAVFLYTPAATAEGQDSVVLSREVSALRDVFQIPQQNEVSGNHNPYNRKQQRRHLEYMKKLYEKVSTGDVELPRHSNTVRSILPILDTQLIDGNISLFYNLSTKPSEKILISELHLDGRRNLRRPRRIVLYLQNPLDKQHKQTKSPVMALAVHKFPLEMDLTRLFQKSQEDNQSKILILQEEQLRKGNWQPILSKRLLRQPPFLVLFLEDSKLSYIENHIIGDLNTQQNSVDQNRVDGYSRWNEELFINHTRDRRSIDDASHNREDNEISFDFEDPATTTTTITASENSLWSRNSIFLTNKIEPEEMASPPLDRSFKISSDKVISNPSKKFSKALTRGQKRSKKGRKDFLKDPSGVAGLHSKYEKEDIFSSEIERRGRKKSKGKRNHRRKNKKTGLLPSPDQYLKWERWQNMKSSKGRKKAASEGRKRKKKGQRKKGIPEHWFTVSLNQMNNDAHFFMPDIPKANTGSSPCHRMELFVDFRRLGWEKFLVAPKGFSSYYCKGFCSSPLESNQAGTNHALVQSLLRTIALNPELPGPCCVPGKLDSLTFLMYDENQRLTLRSIPNMIVRTCSCQ